MKQQIMATAKKILPLDVRNALMRFGFNVARDEFDRFAYQHAFAPNMGMALADAKARGLNPRTIIDIGAFEGDWARMAAATWPGAKITMVEANDEKRELLTLVAGEIGADLRFALLGAEDGREVTFHVMESGSSVFEEESDYDRRKVIRHTAKLDTLLADLPAADFIKLDTQGYELEILTGADRLLSSASAVLMEASLIQINEGAPLLHDVLAFMKERGFVTYEIAEIHRRQLDRAMNQIDILFVRETSPLLASKSFT